MGFIKKKCGCLISQLYQIMASFFYLTKAETVILYSIIKTFRHIYVLNLYITSHIKGLKYEIRGNCLKTHALSKS